jgi:hypothetical protein
MAAARRKTDPAARADAAAPAAPSALRFPPPGAGGGHNKRPQETGSIHGLPALGADDSPNPRGRRWSAEEAECRQRIEALLRRPVRFCVSAIDPREVPDE